MRLKSRCMASQLFCASVISFLFLCALASTVSKVAASKQASSAKQPSPEQELQQAINNAGNDRAALVRNLEAFLKEYPDSRQRPQIYRALVEACLQLRDNTRAAAY